jgi:apolipoprotein N-acyltransferase
LLQAGGGPDRRTRELATVRSPLTPITWLGWVLLATAGGALYALAFPPHELPGAAALMLVPLFVAAARLAPARAALAGLAWSVVATLCVGSWLPATIARFFEIPLAAGGLALAGIALATVGIPSAALCAWIAWSARAGAAGPLAMGAAFGLAEFARANGWPPLPWAILGTGTLPESLRQAADSTGAHGLSILVAAVNAALAAACVPRLRTRRSALEALAVAGLCAAALAHGRAQLAREFGDGAPLSVAVVQPGYAPGHTERARAERVALTGRALELTRALHGRHDLVVWPEHATPAYLRERTPEAETVLALSRELDGDLLLGGPHWRFAEPEPRYFTSAFLLHAGEIHGRHDKTHLVPVAEARYQPGERPRALGGTRARVGALVCAELAFPSVARELARDGAEILANPSNDAWLAPVASEHLLRVASLRAIEVRRPLLRATPTGVSAVIDAHGAVVQRSRSGAPQVLEASLRGSHARTLVQRFGDWPVGLALAIVVGSSLHALLLRPRRNHA